MLQSAMEAMGQIDQDEMTVIIPDTTKEDLLIFGNYLYNNKNINKKNINSSLLQLINFASETHGQSQEESRDFSSQMDDYYPDEEQEQEESPQYNIKDIQDIISNQPRRVKYEEAGGGGKNTKVWKSYKQILVDRNKQHSARNLV